MAGTEMYDLIVIGAGPGGYVAAIRAAQLGMKVACVEKRPTMGGTCLNIGCIPSKALLESSEHFHMASSGLAVHGVKVSGVKLDLKAMLSRKDKVVGELTNGVAGLLKKNKVDVFEGTAKLASPTSVSVTPAKKGAKGRTLNGKQILIASGSDAIELPFAKFDEKQIVSSTGALELTKVPKHLIVIGAGVIGLELGSVWRRLGAEVTVVEMLPKLFGPLDRQITNIAQRVFTKQGFTFHLDTRVTGVEKKDGQVVVTAQKDGETFKLKGDVLLVAIGRRPYADGLGLGEAGVELDPQGRIQVDADFRTSVPSVYAIGDVIAGPMLAHKASEEGIAVAEKLAGKISHITYEAIPWIVYTWPEIAWVGHGEEELKEQGRKYRAGSYPFLANPRAKTMGETDGMVKILADAATDRLLGVLVIGPRASDIIAEAALAMEFGASAEDLARSVHAHPTLSEAIKEAALGVAKRAIHL
ncbi:MAG: dihydrolipoyl dehydrogenase [SAR324 cluster bacterium]|nr:dihydrolipoyl dehydrogenase [SAR324 cluster bacterium]